MNVQHPMSESDRVVPLSRQPLYARVREELVGRMIDGLWAPGQMVPSEFRIAEELGVSQGTVRKALDELAQEGLLVRQQGRGTFVAEAEDKAILFKFYKLSADDESNDQKTTSFPESHFLSIKQSVANGDEIEIFGLDKDARVWRVERLRQLDAQPILWECISLPVDRFPDLDLLGPLPNNLYHLYSQNYGVTISKVKEKLKAVAATARVAGHLGISKGAPLLEIDRCAIALDGQIVEWRSSLCDTQSVSYHNEL